MGLKVIGAGLGRTGTYSLRLALQDLGFGPCFHMEEVAKNLSVQIPLWNAALDGNPNWAAIYDGHNSAVDWPTARFYQELNASYPDAKFILGVRDPRTWAESFSETIHQLTFKTDDPPPQFRDWLAVVGRLIRQNCIPPDGSLDELEAAFIAHCESVEAAIPAERLLVHDVRDGWAPLCAFLGVPVPDVPFPHTNDRSGFWKLIESVT